MSDKLTLQTDPLNERPQHSGMPNDRAGGVESPFWDFNASIRAQLGNSQKQQAIVFNGAHPDTIDLGTAKDNGEATWFVASQYDARVTDIIPRFPNVNQVDNVNFNNHTTVFVQRIEPTGELTEIDVIELPYYHKKAPYGFTYQDTSLREDMDVGSIVRAEQPIVSSPNLHDDGQYGAGMNLETAFMSRHEGTEDSAMVWEGLKDKMIAHRFDEVTIPCTSKDWLANIFGNDTNWIPIPGIGEKVRRDGLLCGHYRVDMANLPLQINKSNIKESREYYDYPKWVVLDSTVIDIKVYRNKNAKSKIPERLRRWLDSFADLDDNYRRRLLDTYDYYLKAGVTISGKLHALAAEWRMLLEGGSYQSQDNGKTKNKRCFASIGKFPLDEYLVSVVTRAEVKINIGVKLADNNGSKTTIGRFVTKEEMPTDEWGRFAKIVLSNEHSANRNTIGQPWEMWYKLTCWHAARIIREKANAGASLNEIRDLVFDFTSRISSDTHYALSEIERDGNINAFIMELLEGRDFDETGNWEGDPFCLFMEMNADDTGYPAFAKIAGSMWDVPDGHLTWRSIYDGKYKRSKVPAGLGTKYYFLLSKDCRYAGACHSPQKQSTGITAKLKPWEKKNSQLTKSAYKVIGEPDSKNLQANLGEEETALLIAMLSNTELHEEKIYTLLNSKDPAQIERSVDYEMLTDLRNQGSRQLAHYLEVFGVELAND